MLEEGTSTERIDLWESLWCNFLTDDPCERAQLTGSRTTLGLVALDAPRKLWNKP